LPGHVFQRRTLVRHRDRGSATVVGAVGPDQRDPRLQHRQAAIQALRRAPGRAPAHLLALCQPFHVLAQVKAAAVVLARARLQQAAADIGVQRGLADAEQAAGLAGGQQVGGGSHAEILIYSIKIDQPWGWCQICRPGRGVIFTHLWSGPDGRLRT